MSSMVVRRCSLAKRGLLFDLTYGDGCKPGM